MNTARREYIFAALLGLFFISLYLPDMPVLTNILIAALFIHCCFINSLRTRLYCLFHRPALLLMLLFFALQVLSAALSVNRHEALAMLVKRSPLAIFPLSIGSIIIRPALRRRLLLLYASVTTLAALFCLIWSIIRCWRLHDTQWLYDDSLTVVIDRQSSYVAWMVTIALFCYTYVLSTPDLTAMRRKIIYAAMAFLLVFHYLLASRSSLIFLYSVILIAVIRHVFTRRRNYLIWVAGSLIVAAAVFLAFPKTLNRFRELQYTGYDFQSRAPESHYNAPVTGDQWNGANIRLAIWNCGFAVARRHWLTGVPLGDKEAALIAEFHARGFAFAYMDKHKKDLHNTYLDVLINTGIPGLVLFLLAFIILPALNAIRHRHLLAMALIAAFATAILFETWIDRALGCILLGFWLSFISAFYWPLSLIYRRTASSVSPKNSSLPWAI